MSRVTWVAFLAAGSAGAVLRYVVDAVVEERAGGPFPWGTLVINASGSLLLGFLTGLGLYHAFPQASRLVLGTGFCGAYTTFSTFTFETVRLAEEGAGRVAWRNVLATLVTGAAAAAAGLALAAI
jgi:fluoride exporter